MITTSRPDSDSRSPFGRTISVIAALFIAGTFVVQGRAAPMFSSFAEVSSNSREESVTGGREVSVGFWGGSAGTLLNAGYMALNTAHQETLTNGSASGTITYSDLFFTSRPGHGTFPETFGSTLRARMNTDAIPGNMSASIAVSNPDVGGGGSDSTFDVTESLLEVPLTNLKLDVFYEVRIEGSVRTSTGSPREAFLSIVMGGSPVFDLPEGITAYSVDGRIEDNLYVGPVPEPASMALLGLSGLSLIRRRSRGFRH
jgi:hypothetical protein